MIQLRVLTFILPMLLMFSFSASARDVNSILNNPKARISASVWKAGVSSYLSKCASGGCPCALVIAEGIQGQNSAANMWIGTFKGGEPIELWAGYASRKLSANSVSVNMDMTMCKRRNGKAVRTSNGMCKVERGVGKDGRMRYRTPKPCSAYESIAQGLGLPSEVELTSFYFGVPMQNEEYKFHDFYKCNAPPCPQTAGCLGLDRPAMKALCVNHMGSNGSNGVNAPKRGGAWLYFHNQGAPPGGSGNVMQAQKGLDKFANGHCTEVSTEHLGTGALATSDGFSNDTSSSDDSSNNSYNRNFDSPSNGMITVPGTQQGGGGGGADAAGATALLGVKGIEIQNALEAEEKQKEEMAKAEAAQYQTCRESLRGSCRDVVDYDVNHYCKDPYKYRRSGCKLEVLPQYEGRLEGTVAPEDE